MLACVRACVCVCADISERICLMYKGLRRLPGQEVLSYVCRSGVADLREFFFLECSLNWDITATATNETAWCKQVGLKRFPPS